MALRQIAAILALSRRSNTATHSQEIGTDQWGNGVISQTRGRTPDHHREDERGAESGLCHGGRLGAAGQHEVTLAQAESHCPHP